MEANARIRETEAVREMETHGRDELKKAHESLMNWGRFVHDSWLRHHLLIAPPPTSEGYLAPVVAYDEPEPAKVPIDHRQGILAEHVVVSIGCEDGGFDSYRVLVRWYTSLVFVDCRQDERYKRLSKTMHCAYDSSPIMLKDAQGKYWERKRVLDGLLKLCCKMA